MSGPPFTFRSSIPPHRARPACPSDLYRRDLLVRSAYPRSMFHLPSPGTRGVPLRPISSEGRPCHVRSSTLDRPLPFGGDSSPAPKAGLKPRTPWSAAIHRRFSVKALVFTTLPLAMFCHNHESTPLVGAIHELPQPTSEGPACRVRRSTFDRPFRLTGHDQRAPPKFTRRRGQRPSNKRGFHPGQGTRPYVPQFGRGNSRIAPTSRRTFSSPIRVGDGSAPSGDRPGQLSTETLVFLDREESYSQSQSNCATAAGMEMKNGSHTANAGDSR